MEEKWWEEEEEEEEEEAGGGSEWREIRPLFIMVEVEEEGRREERLWEVEGARSPHRPSMGVDRLWGVEVEEEAEEEEEGDFLEWGEETAVPAVAEAAALSRATLKTWQRRGRQSLEHQTDPWLRPRMRMKRRRPHCCGGKKGEKDGRRHSQN